MTQHQSFWVALAIRGPFRPSRMANVVIRSNWRDTQAVTTRPQISHMERGESTIEFSLRAGSLPELCVTLRRLSLGWVAHVAGVGAGPGVGRTARQALTAALLPLGDEQTRVVLADIGLLAPSVAVREMDRAVHSA